MVADCLREDMRVQITQHSFSSSRECSNARKKVADRQIDARVSRLMAWEIANYSLQARLVGSILWRSKPSFSVFSILVKFLAAASVFKNRKVNRHSFDWIWSFSWSISMFLKLTINRKLTTNVQQNQKKEGHLFNCSSTIEVCTKLKANGQFATTKRLVSGQIRAFRGRLEVKSAHYPSVEPS